MPKRQFDQVLVSGSLAYDRIMNFKGYFKDHIIPDKAHILNVSFYVHTFRESFGGTAGNIAYNLSLFGVPVEMLCGYGHDFKSYRLWCKKNNMGTAYCSYHRKYPTGSAYIITDKDDNQIAGFFPGAMLKSNKRPPQKLLGIRSIAIISPGNMGDMKNLPRLYQRTSTPYVYDPGQQITSLTKTDLRRAIRGAFGFIGNDYEVSLLQKKAGYSISALNKQCRLVVITKGAQGSILMEHGKRHHIPPAKPKNTSDPTGAGDAYRAGLVYGIIQGYDMPTAGRLGAVASAYTVEKYGTQTHRFTWPALQRRYKQNFKQSLPA